MHAGTRNDITDVPGMAVGHHQRRGRGWLTGTTVVLPPPGTVGGVDVRGGGPGTRETDLLDPRNMVERVDAICLSGGSAYGLAPATGVVDWLAEHHRGFPVGGRPEYVVPIVPAAVLFDLGAGGDFHCRPDAAFGYAATAAARPRKVVQGTVGAGTGAHAGGMKGGIGSASVVLEDGTTIGALVALNPGGSTVDPATGELWGARYGLAGEFDHLRPPTKGELAAHLAAPALPPPLNTTLVVIATDARLTKAELARLAGSGQDGMARAVRPIHQYTDGDVVFALATGARELTSGRLEGVIRPSAARPGQVNQLLGPAADVVARAIAHAMLAATSVRHLQSYRDRFPSALRVTADVRRRARS